MAFYDLSEGNGESSPRFMLDDPRNKGGLGLHQAFWAYWARCATVMQDLLRKPGHIKHMSKQPIPHSVPTRQNYVHILQEIRVYMLMSMSDQQVQPRGAPDLFDIDSSDDLETWRTQEKKWWGEMNIPTCTTWHSTKFLVVAALCRTATQGQPFQNTFSVTACCSVLEHEVHNRFAMLPSS